MLSLPRYIKPSQVYQTWCEKTIPSGGFTIYVYPKILDDSSPARVVDIPTRFPASLRCELGGCARAEKWMILHSVHYNCVGFNAYKNLTCFDHF